MFGCISGQDFTEVVDPFVPEIADWSVLGDSWPGASNIIVTKNMCKAMILYQAQLQTLQI